MSRPGATESLQWGEHLVFKVGGKIFAIANLEAAGRAVSFKCSPEEYAELIEMEGIIPAPYFARAHWVALERWDALEPRALRARLDRAYDLVRGRLTKKAQAAFQPS